jgi:hypothetical protein
MLLMTATIATSCDGGQKTFTDIALPDVGIGIKVAEGWLMAVKRSDKSAFEHRLSHQPEYVFAPVTAAKGDPLTGDIYHIPNWRFIGLKGEFDPEMSAFSPDYPKPDGLYFVKPLKGELVEQYTQELPWTGAQDVKAVVRLYEETHGSQATGTSDLWHAYTVTFNHKGNAMEFNFRIPSDVDKQNAIDDFWKSIVDLELS